MIEYCLFDTPIGACGLAWSPRGLRAVQLPERDAEHTRARLLGKLGPAREGTPPPWVEDVVDRLRAHLAGQPQSLVDVPLDLDGVSPLHARIYEELREVPAGATLSYGELAERAGSRGAARAVGAAMARNPLPLVVPCHRVLAANGRPGGFSAHDGVALKARILSLEGVRLAGVDPGR